MATAGAELFTYQTCVASCSDTSTASGGIGFGRGSGQPQALHGAAVAFELQVWQPVCGREKKWKRASVALDGSGLSHSAVALNLPLVNTKVSSDSG